MSKTPTAKTAIFFALSLILGAPGALASLGGVSSLSTRAQLVARGSGYSIRESTGNGTRVREYVRSDGTVFAVTWEGLSQPDLRSLLGSYYERYESALEKAPLRGGGIRELRSGGLAVERSGHMRDVRGKAYAPALFPEGFGLEKLQ